MADKGRFGSDGDVPEGVDINFDDDLESWGETDDTAAGTESSDIDAQQTISQSLDDALFREETVRSTEAHNKPTRPYQTQPSSRRRLRVQMKERGPSGQDTVRDFRDEPPPHEDLEPETSTPDNITDSLSGEPIEEQDRRGPYVTEPVLADSDESRPPSEPVFSLEAGPLPSASPPPFPDSSQEDWTGAIDEDVERAIDDHLPEETLPQATPERWSGSRVAEPIVTISSSDWDPGLLPAEPTPEPLPDPISASDSVAGALVEVTAKTSSPETPPLPEILEQAPRVPPDRPFDARDVPQASPVRASSLAEPPRIRPLPLQGPLPEGEESWLTSFQAYKTEAQRLARVGKWRDLAAITGHALLNAPYAARMTRTGMLLDLARICRDRLHDEDRAEEAFKLVVHEDPSNAEALSYLVDLYQRRSDWGAIFDLYMLAVETTWDPHERLSWTRQAASLAREKLDDVSLAIRAWEHLWRLGDAQEEASRELSRLYRRASRWAEMAEFLRQQAVRVEGAAQLVVLRELAEVLLSGLQDPDGASAVLEQIVERSPQDPIATLQLARVYTQRQDWEALERLGEHAAERQVPAEAALDLQHLVADALWQAGRLQQAVVACDRILEVAPSDSLATSRKQEFLTRSARSDELLSLLISKADATDDDDERASLLAQAAELAETEIGLPEQAAKLLERRITIDAEHLPSYQALARLYENMGDLRGVARAMEGQLVLTKEPRRRIELLRQLGNLYAVRMKDDDRAEVCWKEILSLDPSDLGVREELIELHRRRGDFDSLHSALMRQIWLTTDDGRAQMLSRMAAENLDQNFDSPVRSVEAWRRVLDFAPLDPAALQALNRHYRSLQQRLDLISALEQEVRALPELTDKIDRALQVARLWMEQEAPKAAAATYERILRWHPTHSEAIQELVGIYRQHDQRGKAAGVLEHASLLKESPTERIALLRQVLELMDSDDHVRRFYLIRRILILAGGDRQELKALRGEAEAAQLWPEFAATLVQMVAQEPSISERIILIKELAGVLEEKLQSPQRAYLALQRIFLSPEQHDELEGEVTRLARATGRHEDLLAVLERLTTPDFDLQARKAVISNRAEIYERDLEDGLRAFQEHRRLVELDADEREVLVELERLAGAHGLWVQMDAILAELIDRSRDTADRSELLSRRISIHRDRLDSRQGAFDLLALQLRMAPEKPEVRLALEQDAEALGGWSWALPLQEGASLYSEALADSQDLARTASLYEEKLQDLPRAFHLTALAFMAQPDEADLAPKLEELAPKVDRWEGLADIFRLAAAVSQDRERTVGLLRRIAAIYVEKLQQPNRAIDIHSRLLDLKEDEIPSLEVMIDWHRGRSEWRDLRDRLRQRIRLAKEGENRVLWLVEIAQISEQHLKDPETALQTYGEILEIDPEHEEARQGLDGLVRSIAEPNLRLRWLEMQLKGAEVQRAQELRMEIATLKEEDQEDLEGAITTLMELVQESGPGGAGFTNLTRLLRTTKRWRDLVLQLRAKSEAEQEPTTKLAALEEAMAICAEHLGDAAGELWEDLYRAVLQIQPENRDIRVRLARYLRQEGRFEDLSTLLTENLEHLQDPADRSEVLYERARLQALNLERMEDACATWKQLVGERPEELGALLALARAAATRGEMKTYIEHRRQQARLLPPVEAALVLCHLAEVADENKALASQMVPLYREARTLDPNNMPAMEALKGIGRRLKNLRPAAALLPLEGERDLDRVQRTQRLKALGDAALDSDLPQAIEWYRRAVAVNPDDPEAWFALSEGMEERPNPEEVFRARQSWLQALERQETVQSGRLIAEAERIYNLALCASAANLPAVHARLIHRAYDLVPHYAPAALSMAQMMIEAGRFEQAHSLLHTILSHHWDDLTEPQRVTAMYSRGLTLRKMNRPEQAMTDIREVLRLMPLHPEALAAMGEMLAESGRTAAAIEIQIRALTTVEEIHERAELYYKLGVLWEDGMGAVQEAGVCYELALAEGLEHRDLLHRTLRHLQRTGRLDQSLEVVDSLLPTAQDPDELATLWMVRGEIFAAREGQEDAAIEAFDMALSYDPTRHQARNGLCLVLERQGDWDQLLQVLEATVDSGTPEQRSQALRRMADICSLMLGDPGRAEQYLRQSVEIHPTRDALEQLERIYTYESGRLEERLEVLGLLTRFGPPWFDRCLEIAKMLLTDDKAWAWCLLSPLLGVSQVDPEIKSVIQAMRKEYERPPILSYAASDYELLLHEDASALVTGVLAELGELLHPIGISSLDSAGDGNAIPIGENTTMGKTFGAVAEAMGMAGVTLYRTQSLNESVVVVNTLPHPCVVVRTDVMQQLVHAEVGFLFACVLELARPGHRVMAALPKDSRDQLVPALWLALELAESGGKQATKLAERIRECVPAEQREVWASRLGELRGEDPIELGRRWYRGVCHTARRAGLLAGADLRQIFRVMSRLEEEVGRPRVVARIEELDQYVEASEILQDLVAFAASPGFGKLMKGATTTGSA